MQYKDKDGTWVTIYTPNERQGGLLWGVEQARADIWGARYVIWRLFLRDFTAQFKQKILGYIWALLGPLLGILNFLFLYFTGVLQPGQGGMPYTLYVLLGSSIWSCLPGALGSVSGGLQAQADLIMRTRIPKIALAVSSLAGLCYSTLIGLITIIVVFLLYGIVPSWYIALYPLLILSLLLLGVAIGLVLAVLGVIARDLTQLTMQGLALVMYITPIIYLPETISNPFVKKLIEWNPLTYLVDVPRSLLVYGTAGNMVPYCWISFGVFVCVILGLRVFYLLEDLVAERL